jgi:GT2 family glycosyltransferase
MNAPQRIALQARKKPAPAARSVDTTVPSTTTAKDLTVSAPQVEPVLFRDESGQTYGALRVDSAAATSGLLELQGWLVGEGTIALHSDGAQLASTMVRGKRPDVSVALNLAEPAQGFGFSLSASWSGSPCELSVTYERLGRSKTHLFPLDVKRPEYQQNKLLSAVGHLEGAVLSPSLLEGVVVGWVVQDAQTEVWLQDDQGGRYDLTKAYRFYRKDVFDIHAPAYGAATRESGFLIRISAQAPGTTIKLLARRAGQSWVVSDIPFAPLPSKSTQTAQWLFHLISPLSELTDRFAKVDEPVLRLLLGQEQQQWPDLPVHISQLGVQPTAPAVSVIVPLYGRINFVEHQLMEFCRDAEFLASAELIYVVDDPDIVEAFRGLAEMLYRLYKVPFRWVWGSVNRGFSGANNLGASVARGEYIAFVNSDVIPQSPGWLAPLTEVLATRSDVGCVAPRLTFVDGSIQHAGMTFLRREDLGVWINDHPGMGLHPSLDPCKELSIVPAVTGACLVMRRADLDAVDGWDTGYLIGDFEDSDLCLKLRNAGLASAYLPSVQLTHLERQSFKLVGADQFRMCLVIYNAARHQRRWGKLIDPSQALAASTIQHRG